MISACEATGRVATMRCALLFLVVHDILRSRGVRRDVHRDRRPMPGRARICAPQYAQRYAHKAAEQLLLRISLLLLMTLALARCGHNAPDSDSEINVYPANYKSDILAAMHAYLNDPTGIRGASISEPALKPPLSRYVVCLRFTAKKNAREYAAPKEIAAVFLAGRFDRFVDTPKDECAGMTYAAFPELQTLSP
jgi:hypothetical protein